MLLVNNCHEEQKSQKYKKADKSFKQLDGCIVWNAHNTVFGSKRSFL